MEPEASGSDAGVERGEVTQGLLKVAASASWLVDLALEDR